MWERTELEDGARDERWRQAGLTTTCSSRDRSSETSDDMVTMSTGSTAESCGQYLTSPPSVAAASTLPCATLAQCAT